MAEVLGENFVCTLELGKGIQNLSPPNETSSVCQYISNSEENVLPGSWVVEHRALLIS